MRIVVFIAINLRSLLAIMRSKENGLKRNKDNFITFQRCKVKKKSTNNESDFEKVIFDFSVF